MKWLSLSLALLIGAALLAPPQVAPATPPRMTDTPEPPFELPYVTPGPTDMPPYPAPAQIQAAAAPLVFAAVWGDAEVRRGETFQVVVAVYSTSVTTEAVTLDQTIPPGLTLVRTRWNQAGASLDHPALAILDYRVGDTVHAGLLELRYNVRGVSTSAWVRVGRPVALRLWLPLVGRYQEERP